MFDSLWTILLGIIGGIISSVIVSRVFMIKSECQQQLKIVENIMRKLGMISAYFFSCKAVFEVSYDEEIRMEREKKEKGYKSEMEYYAAHNDRRWISKEEILQTFKSKILQVANSAKEEIFNTNLGDTSFNNLMQTIDAYLLSILAIKELNFSVINKLEKSEKAVLDKVDSFTQISDKRVLKLVLQDKTMIVLYVIVFLILAGTIVAYFLEH